MTRQMDNNLNEGTARFPAKSSPCYYCLENGHLIANCDHKEHHIRIGWIQIDKGGFMRLGDGTALPRYPSDMSRRDRVEKHYNRLGQTVARQEERMRTLIQGANYNRDVMMRWEDQNFQEEDCVLDMYDPTDDYRKSRDTQMLLQTERLAQARAPGPITTQYVPQTYVPQQVAPVAANVQANVPPPMAQPTEPGKITLDGAQLASLIIAAQSMDSESLQQFIATCTGEKGKAPEGSGFH